MALLFTIIATLFNTFYLICQERAGNTGIDPVWAFRIGSTSACLIAWTLTFPAGNLIPNRDLAIFTSSGVVWAILIGVAAAGIDFNTISAFFLKIDLSTCGPIIEVGSAALLCLIGLMMGEKFHPLKIACVIPMLGGGIGLVILHYKGIIK